MTDGQHMTSSTDRADELARLRRLLLDKRARVVNIHGAQGSGKTALARTFVERYGDAYPGGVTWFKGESDWAPESLMKLRDDATTLLIADEIDRADLSSIAAGFAWLEQHRPLNQTITISTMKVGIGPDTPGVEMPPLPLAAVLDLLVSQSPNRDQARIARLAQLLEGNAAAVEDTSRRLASGMPVERIIAWLEQRRLVVARDAQGAELALGSPRRQRIDAVVSEISDELINELAADPTRLYQLEPRRFEQLIAELYRRRGFEARLTPASGDEGVDIYVVRNDDIGRTLWVVQAKRYAPHRKVGAGVVRELFGTVNAKHASAGILVTTSFFEPGAARLEQQFQYRVNLRDYLNLQDMLRW